MPGPIGGPIGPMCPIGNIPGGPPNPSIPIMQEENETACKGQPSISWMLLKEMHPCVRGAICWGQSTFAICRPRKLLRSW